MDLPENAGGVATTSIAMAKADGTENISIAGSVPCTAHNMRSPEETEVKDAADRTSVASESDVAGKVSDRESLMALMGEPTPSLEPGMMLKAPAYPEGNPTHSLAINAPHPDTSQILRQVEFYFSDENLPYDSHLLSFAGSTGDGWVSLNRILGFTKMRKYKPKPNVKAALRQSTFLEVGEKLKYVRRKTPLDGPPQVSPKESEETGVAKNLIEKPWLSKGMLKPTGFEEGFTEAPLKPEEYAREQQLFDPDEAFTIRMEYAVSRYMSKRKMHQGTLNVFSKFLTFGGFDGSPRQFTGGFDEKDLEDYTKDEIMRMKASFGISDLVIDGLEEDQEGGPTWVVDFENMTKAFFSSHFLQHFDWMDDQVTNNATNVVINFYNYLQYHRVCPEYAQNLLDARELCFTAQKELPKLANTARELPGDFNTACSTLFGGYYAIRRPFNPNAEWVNPDDDIGWSDEEAKTIWHTAIVAHCTPEQYKQFEKADEDGSLTIGGENRAGLEIVEVEFPSDTVKALYGSRGIKDTFVKPTGKMICKNWVVPGAPKLDIPKELVKSRQASLPRRYEFLVEEDVLRFCYPGMKLDATVMRLNVVDISYLDCVHFVYPSFFTWTLNERIREISSSGPPKEWMKRQNAKHKSDDGIDVAEVEGEGPDVEVSVGQETDE